MSGGDHQTNRTAKRSRLWTEAQNLGDADAMRKEIEHLRTLATMNTDPKVLDAIEALIHELEQRIRLSGNGQASTS